MKVGDSVRGDEYHGDSLTVALAPRLENSIASAPWDEDGLPLQPLTLIERGVLKRYWGQQRFCHCRQPVSGGSISGNIQDVQREMYLSAETQTFHNFRGPRTVQLLQVRITGAR